MQGSKLYVGNLNYSVTNEDLEELFSSYGELRQVKVIEGKGFAFVEFANSSAAQNAKEALNGTEFKTRVLKVDNARPPRTKQKRYIERF